MNLAELSHRVQATVTALQGEDGETRCALLRLGLIPGTGVRVLRAAPMGDPLQVEVAGAHLALRRDVAAYVQVAVGERA
jgi:ferrous iron transport protein A